MPILAYKSQIAFIDNDNVIHATDGLSRTYLKHRAIYFRPL